MHVRGGGALALPLPGIRLGLPAGGLLESLAAVTEHRLLDRLIRGRGWIGLVAFALIGIVAMQLWIVKLGVGIGRALEHEAFLQRENAALSVQDARLSAGERVEALASARGMVAVAPGSVRFDASRGALDARLAAAALARAEQAHPSATSTTTTAGVASSTTSTTGGEGAASGESTAASGESAAGSGEGSTASGESAQGGAGSTGSGETSAQTTPEASGAEGSSERTGAPSAASGAATAESAGGGEATAGG